MEVEIDYKPRRWAEKLHESKNMKKGYIQKKCDECGILFERYIYFYILKYRPFRFCSKKCELKQRSRQWSFHNPMQGIDNSGKNNPMWGKVAPNRKLEGAMRKDGYIRIYDPSRKTRVLLHRFLYERHLGRRLAPYEIVHHKDGNNLNNDIFNLEVMTQNDHMRIHDPRGWKRHLNAGGNYHRL